MGSVENVPEAPLEDGGSGLAPAAEGWFVVNTRDAEWWTSASFGHSTDFQSEKFPFREVGFHVAVLEPGQPNGLYHSEALQEDFLVVAGECKLLVEGEERELRAWDFFHCTAGVEHIFVGSGDEPCVIVMVGARVANVEDEGLFYPVSELAARYRASARAATGNAKEAYAPFEWPARGRPAFWDQLPWAK